MAGSIKCYASPAKAGGVAHWIPCVARPASCDSRGRFRLLRLWRSSIASLISVRFRGKGGVAALCSWDTLPKPEQDVDHQDDRAGSGEKKFARSQIWRNTLERTGAFCGAAIRDEHRRLRPNSVAEHPP